MKTRKLLNNQKGFTLVELLVVVVITAIMGTVILNLYIQSSRTYNGQLQVAEAQQNIRVGIDSLVFDLRMAGFDPTSEADAGIVSIDPEGDGVMNSIQFTMDLTDDAGTGEPDGNLVDASSNPDPGENITYDLYTTSGVQRLGRYLGTGTKQPVAEYLDAIAFAYAFDSNDDGELDTDAGGRIHWAILDPAGGANWWELDANDDDLITIADDTDADDALNVVDTGIVADVEDIRAVKIWVLGRAPQKAQDYNNNSSYVVGDRVVKGNNDSFRRRLLTTSVYCRNMGI